jgi:hypothetical protein
MGDIAPLNQGLFGSMPTHGQNRTLQMRDAAERVTKERPDLIPVYNEFFSGWIDAVNKGNDDYKAAKTKEPHAKDSYLQEVANKPTNAFVNNFRAGGGKNQEAVDLLSDEVNPSMFRGITNNFYDKSEGGMQWGGVIGGVLGVLVGMFMGGGTGSWMGIIAMIAGALAGGMIGDRVGDAMRGPRQPAAGGGTSPDAARGQGQEQEADSPEAALRRERARGVANGLQERKLDGGEHVDDKQSALLAPGTSASSQSTQQTGQSTTH